MESWLKECKEERDLTFFHSFKRLYLESKSIVTQSRITNPLKQK